VNRIPASRSRVGLTHDAIVTAARDLLNEHGADAVTMRRVAARLGVGTMTLYGYFPDKDALLDAIIDASGSELAPPVPEGDWKSSLRTLMLALHAQLIEHPFLVELRLRRPIVSAQAMRWTEAALGILARAGLSPGAAMRAFRPLFVYTFGHAAFTPHEGEPGVVDRARAGVLTLPPEEYPLAIAAAQELTDVLVGQEPYELGLDLLLDGIESRLPPRG
jgi:TetR/AcrR family tetracycline transcriptional repressor